MLGGIERTRPDVEVVDEDGPRIVIAEVVNPARPLSRDELLRSANVEPFVAPPPPTRPAPTHLKADAPIEDRVRMVLANVGGFSCDPAQYRQLRVALVQHAERFPDERESVEQAIATFDARFGVIWSG